MTSKEAIDHYYTKFNEYYYNNFPRRLNISEGLRYKLITETFDAGVESEKKKHEWHDIIKNPTDLPKVGSHVLVKVTYRENIEQHKFDSYNIFMAVYGDGYYFHEIGNTFYELSCYRKDGSKDNLCSVLDNTFAWKEID